LKDDLRFYVLFLVFVGLMFAIVLSITLQNPQGLGTQTIECLPSDGMDIDLCPLLKLQQAHPEYMLLILLGLAFIAQIGCVVEALPKRKIFYPPGYRPELDTPPPDVTVEAVVAKDQAEWDEWQMRR
jgi:hypothetical protein